MRVMARAQGFLPRMEPVDVHADLRDVISRIAAALRFYSRPVWRRCGVAWRRHMRSMDYYRLRVELRFLLSHCGLRRIASFHERYFRNVGPALLIASEFVREIGMQDAALLSNMMSAYRELRAYEALLADDSDASTVFMGASGRENPVARQLSFESSDDDDDDDDGDDADRESFGTSPSETDISSEDDDEQNQQSGREEGEQERAVDQEEEEEEEEQEEEERVEPAEHEQEQQQRELTLQAVECALATFAPSDSINVTANENGNIANRRLPLILRHYNEPYEAVVRAIMSDDPRPSTSRNTTTDDNDVVEVSRSRMLLDFYTRRAPESERGFTSIDDNNRPFWNYFDESSALDRRANEFIRRRSKSNDGLSTPGYDTPNLLLYAKRILNVRRAQELRWFHDQAEDLNSSLYTEHDLKDLLDRVRDCFHGEPED